ncbi:MAG: hypothetical protein RBQ97_09820 [Acholeplasma sp.]|nr:hypothetical protein [Acholeplasma sp.]
MKKIFTFILLVLSLVFGMFNPSVLKAEAEDVNLRDLVAYNPTLQNYVLLDEDSTKAGWIQTDTYENNTVKNPIIFFNLNPATNFETVTKIFFTVNQDSGLGSASLFENEIVDEVGNVVTTIEFKNSVSFDEMHEITFYENYKTHYGVTHVPGGYSGLKQEFHKEYQLNLMSEAYELTDDYEKSEIGGSFWKTYSKNQFHFKLPELGKIDYLRKFYSYVDLKEPEYGPSMRDSFIYEYKNDPVNNGYASWSSLSSMLDSSYTHYLVLPIKYTEGFNVTYLAVEGYDTNGNFISPIPVVEEGEVVDPGTNNPETLNYVSLSKTNNTWNTSNAMFFPGNNVYKLRYIELTSVQYVVGTVNYSMKAYVGNLLTKDEVSIDATNLNKVYILASGVNTASYIFIGSSNTLIIDANENVLSFTAKVYYEIVSDIPTLQSPIMINLVDENGNPGIAGLLPLEENPDQGNWWDWLNDLFGLNINLSDPLTLVKLFLALAFGILVFYVLYKLITLLSFAFPKRRR